MRPPNLLSRHAVDRSRTRRIPLAAIEAVLSYGAARRDRGAEIYTLGWRQVRRWAEHGVALSHLEGVEVVCGNDGRVITVYRKRKPASARHQAFRRAA